MVFPPLFLRFLPSSSSLPFAFRVSWSNAFPANSCRAARFIDLLLLDNGDSCRYLLEMKLSFLSIRRICVEHLGIFTETGRGTAGGGVVFTIGLKPALRKIVSRLFLIYSFPIIITHSSATGLFNNSCNSYKWFVQFFHLSRFENVFFLVRFALQRNTLRFERNGNYNSYDEYDYSIQCYREINQSFVVLIIIDISSIIWTKFRWWSRRENSWFWSSRWAEKHGERGVQRGNFADSLRNHDRLSYLRGWIHFVGKCYNCGRYNFKKKIHGFIFLFLIYINRRDCWF